MFTLPWYNSGTEKETHEDKFLHSEGLSAALAVHQTKQQPDSAAVEYFPEVTIPHDLLVILPVNKLLTEASQEATHII